MSWKGERFIRRCVAGDKEHYWIFSPINLNDRFRSVRSKPFNIDDTQIIGSLIFILNFGNRNSTNTNKLIDKFIQDGDICNLLKISRFRRAKETDYDFDRLKEK